ncbi:MAG TPA: hypothetical protein VFG30_38185, partial [Polyangiales bacterium]|nr:hypothetical protein [Polyangiales bacterium]
MAFRVSMLFGPEASDIVRWLALLISYFAHALIWTGLAALLARRKSVIPAMKNLLWRLALLGPLVTTVVPATLPIGRAWSLETTEIQHSAPAATAIGSQRVTFADRSVMQRAKLIPSGAVAARWIARGSVASRVLALLLVLASGLGLLRFGISVARLLHALAGRKRVRDARLCSRFDALRRRAGVPHARLRESAR